MQVVRLQIPGGEPGTDATVRIIRQLIESGKRSSEVRRLAEWILRVYQVPARDQLAEIAAIHRWAKTNIRYLQDPFHVEYVQTADKILSTRTGDCDDFTVLVGSLIEAIGYPVDIKVVARPGRKNFHHVYPVARIGTESIGLDASMPIPLGYESSEINRSKTYRRESTMLSIFSGMAGLGLDITPVIVPKGGAPVVITGGNGTRKIVEPYLPGVVDVEKMIPHFVRGVSTIPGNTLVISPGNPLRDYYVRKLYDQGFFVAAPGSQLTRVDFAGGISEVKAMPKGNGGPVVYPPPPDVPVPTRGGGAPGGVVGPNGVPVVTPITPAEGAGQFGPTIYLKLGESWAGYDAKLRMQTGNIRPASWNLMLVFSPYQTLVANGGGTVTAVLRPANGNGGVIPQPYDPVIYDTYGQPTTPVPVSYPSGAVPSGELLGIPTNTLLLIGGGLLVAFMLMKGK